MWEVHQLDVRERVLDFTSSGQGYCPVRALYGDSECLVNTITHMEFDDSPDLQVNICEACGFVHCEPGGWICLRRFGTFVLWVPCFDAMGEDEAAASEYAPPRYRRGLPFFSDATYAQLRALVPGFPSPETVPPLRSKTAALLLQLEAPGRVLGRFPGIPFLRRDRVAAVDGDVADAVARLNSLLELALSDDHDLQPKPNAVPVQFFLDLPGTPVWSPLACLDGKDSMCLNDICAVSGDGSA